MLLLLLACQTDCESQSGNDRENCRFEAVKAAWTTGNPTALDQALAAIPDPVSRDLARARLAVLSPKDAAKLCADVQTEPAKKACQQVIGRPHLQGLP